VKTGAILQLINDSGQKINADCFDLNVELLSINKAKDMPFQHILLLIDYPFSNSKRIFMSTVLIVLGVVMIVVGARMNISKHSLNDLAGQPIGNLVKTGFRGYFKYLLIIVGSIMTLVGIAFSMIF
jgi:hypothetical protein